MSGVGAGRPIRLHGMEFGAASSGQPRSHIRWFAEARRRNISFVAYNTRFLILPWVRVSHVASHIPGAWRARCRGPVVE
jgi:hypothetical protein